MSPREREKRSIAARRWWSLCTPEQRQRRIAPLNRPEVRERRRASRGCLSAEARAAVVADLSTPLRYKIVARRWQLGYSTVARIAKEENVQSRTIRRRAPC